MTTHNRLAGAEHEDDDVDRLCKAVGDDFAIALDRNGWEIRMKDGCRPRTLGTVDNLWRINRPSTATQAWAFHDEDGNPLHEVEYRPFNARHARRRPDQTRKLQPIFIVQATEPVAVR
jgi:hypothetical protein